MAAIKGSNDLMGMHDILKTHCGNLIIGVVRRTTQAIFTVTLRKRMHIYF